jgi:hypothetical protein
VSKTPKPQSKPQFTEEVLLHGDSITFTAAKVSDKPSRIKITAGTIILNWAERGFHATQI